MKYFSFLIFTVFIFNPSIAQKKADSLKEIWYNTRCDDGNRLRAINILIEDYYLHFL